MHAKCGGLAPRKERHVTGARETYAQLPWRNGVHAVIAETVKLPAEYVIMEELNLKGLVAGRGARKRGLNRAILSQSLGYFKQWLTYEAEGVGGYR